MYITVTDFVYVYMYVLSLVSQEGIISFVVSPGVICSWQYHIYAVFDIDNQVRIKMSLPSL